MGNEDQEMNRYTNKQFTNQRSNFPYGETQEMDRYKNVQFNNKQTDYYGNENQGMDRYTNMQFSKQQSNYPVTGNKGEYATFTAQRNDDRNSRLEQFLEKS